MSLASHEIKAGSSGGDAKNTSPARVAQAITVGAAMITDARAPYSNYGSVVDIHAPGACALSESIGARADTLKGQDITSTW